MVIKEENTRRIQELEAEFSDEKIAELFNSDDDLREKKRIRKRREARRAAARLIVLITVIACVLLLVLFNPKVNYEDSMEDTIKPRDMIMLSVMAYQNADVSFGDVIVCRSAMMDEHGDMIEVCSRVIGIPGDVLEIRDGYVFRNDEKLDEPYTKDGRTDGKMMHLTIPENYYFVLGDNRQNSVDSRDHRVGLVNVGQIEGKVVFRLLPVSRMGRIN